LKSTVKKLMPGGYGFIDGEERDFFFHASELKGVAIEDLFEGQVVEFEPSENEKGLNATNITLEGTE